MGTFARTPRKIEISGPPQCQRPGHLGSDLTGHATLATRDRTIALWFHTD